MLKTRIIPTLLWKNTGLVKGIAFDSWRRVGTLLPAVKIYNLRDVDELIIVDISATVEELGFDYAGIMEASKECFVPLTVGGGIKDMSHIKKILRSGADKITINTATFTDPKLIKHATEEFGSQCVVVSCDVRKTDSGYECFSYAGTRPTGIDPASWVQKMEYFGAGEILLTSIDRDGSMEGYDLDLIEYVSKYTNLPVIASGGAGNYYHMLEAIKSGADAVAAASIFHFTEQIPIEAKRYLLLHGIHVRM